MNILILAGGTGSIALQKGLHHFTNGLDGVNVKILTNAYDNGLSTGIVRQVMGGEILGPSDVRKNQLTIASLNLNNKNNKWKEFLDKRFTKETSVVHKYCLEEVETLRSKLKADVTSNIQREYEAEINKIDLNVNLVKEAIDVYFASPISTQVDYNDFSLANIIYAGFARAHGNSLRAAAKIMSQILEIPDNVIINDDRSMFLGAVSKSGQRVTDEGEIVFWGKEDDPFVDVFFTDNVGRQIKPILCEEARQAILDADLIILSSGTQWSSLIPTYASDGFYPTIAKSSAKIVMVMNKVPDKDSPGQTATDIIDAIVPRFFEKGRLHVVLDTQAAPSMRELSVAASTKVASVTIENLSTVDFTKICKDSTNVIDGIISRNSIEFVSPMPPDSNVSSKHNPILLGATVLSTYFKEYIDFDTLVFDYDDTLVGRGNSTPKSSKFNRDAIRMLNMTRDVAICTGNSIKAIKISKLTDMGNKPLTIYADGGANKYEYYGFNPNSSVPEHDIIYKYVECVDRSCLLPLDPAVIVDILQSKGLPPSKIQNRGDAMIAIKPIDETYRECVKNLIILSLKNTADSKVDSKDSPIDVRVAGRSTIEIASVNLSKASAIKYILEKNPTAKITYVGDEFEDGNDSPILELAKQNPSIKCLSVSSPTKSAMFLKLFYDGVVHE